MTQQQTVLSWLKDAHAMEVSAVPTLKDHAAAAEGYPDVQAKLNEHANATRRHAYLVVGCIERLGGHPSALKETVGTVMGKVTGVANLPAKDTVIKNALGDYAAENFEVACYKSLVAAAEKLGDQETADVCRRILRNEEEMAGWLGGHIATLTQKFVNERTGEDGQTPSGTLGNVKQTVAGLGAKGKELASNVGARSAFLTAGVLLAGSGAALLVGLALRGTSKENRQEGKHTSKIRGVIIDVDGTLVDSNDVNAQAWVDALSEYGHQVQFERARGLVGMGSDTFLPEAIGVEKESPEGSAISERRSAIFKERYLPTVKPFPQTRALIERMQKQGLKLAVASSAQADELAVLLKLAGVDDLLKQRVSASDADASKPNPDIVVAALEKLGMRAEEVVMLGDTAYDIEAAKKAGVLTVALRSGGWQDTDLEDAVEMYNDPADLLANYDTSWLVS